MTSSPTHASNKTLQIALVGVRPADQVMLKGYMRVILRLETGLEWVSANHSSVDFYIVNYEFAQADSVQKLLATHPNAAVLYVQRDETSGGMVDNVLTLPLKELEQLKAWLASHIDLVNDIHHGTTNLPTDNTELAKLIPPATPAPSILPVQTPAAPQTRMTLDEIIASRNKASSVQPSVTPNFVPDLSINLVDVFRQLQQSDEGILSLVRDGKLIAYIHPKRQRVWVMNDVPVFTPDINIVSNPTQISLESQPSLDLVQWLWEKTYDMPLASIQQLAKDNVTYHITSWVKPNDSQPTHDILKVQCVLEAREVNLSELLQLSNVSRETCLRTVASLVASGLMPSTVYSKLKDMPTIDSVLDMIPVDTHATSNDISPAQPHATANAVTAATSTMPAHDKPADEGMKGFLSKLRRKLGL